jgi:hypothetical protein
MYKIEHLINAKATTIRDGRETELLVGDYLTQAELNTLKVYGDKLVYRIDQDCTVDVCGLDIGAYLPPVEPQPAPTEPKTKPV